jgi:hypothetical protein
MGPKTSPRLSGSLREPWKIVPQHTFNGIFVGLLGVCQTVLLVYFAPTRPEIAFPVGSGGMLLLWIAGNVRSDNDPLAGWDGTDDTHGWFYLVGWSVISIAAVLSTAIAVLSP